MNKLILLAAKNKSILIKYSILSMVMLSIGAIGGYKFMDWKLQNCKNYIISTELDLKKDALTKLENSIIIKNDIIKELNDKKPIVITKIKERIKYVQTKAHDDCSNRLIDSGLNDILLQAKDSDKD